MSDIVSWLKTFHSNQTLVAFMIATSIGALVVAIGKGVVVYAKTRAALRTGVVMAIVGWAILTVCITLGSIIFIL